ncbi:casein kinase 1, epsilon, partial [Sistotremastrum suecicum HHB10207 ss-3]
GEVYSAAHLHSGTLVAIKFEDSRKNEGTQEMLPLEHAIYQVLRGGVGIPSVYWFGKEETTNMLVMDLLGPTLETLRFFCRGRLSLKTVLMIADQLISTLEFIHSRGVVCRDLKPENLAMGRGPRSHIVHIFDFGLSRSFKDAVTGQHIPFRDGLMPIGAPRYSSQASFLGHEQGRKDDLESLGFILVWLLTGSLPWKGILAPSIPLKIQKMGQMKAAECIPKICENCPEEFLTYLRYCRSLEFASTPDYHMLRGLFGQIMEKEGWQYDGLFDWSPNITTAAGNLLPDHFI